MAKRIVYVRHAYEDNLVTVYGSAKKAVDHSVGGEDSAEEKLIELRDSGVTHFYSCGDTAVTISREFIE